MGCVGWLFDVVLLAIKGIGVSVDALPNSNL